MNILKENQLLTSLTERELPMMPIHARKQPHVVNEAIQTHGLISFTTPILEIIIAHINPLDPSRLTLRASCSRFKALIQPTLKLRQFACEEASCRGYLEILAWAVQKKYTILYLGQLAAARGGKIEVLQWFEKQGYALDLSLCSEAAKGGDLATFQWLRGRGCPWDMITCAGNAASSGNLALLQSIHRECRVAGVFCGTVCLEAAQKGHRHIIEWALTKGYSLNNTPSFLPQEGEPGFMPEHTDFAVDAAALGGQQQLVEWLLTKGAKLTALTCSKAAEGGHLKLLTWLVQQGCPWDLKVIKMAAVGGSLDILIWPKRAAFWMEA